ncbi:hypothetical protein G6F31_014204 [Rhizopus arrhizus]|nr:hypothetical protein G6F31_014204 [Rhizopus arrhizus]
MTVPPASWPSSRRSPVADVAVPGNVGHAIRALRAAFPSPKAHQDAWRKRCAQHRDRFAARYDAPGQHIYAPALLKRLSELAPADAVIACDVGQHQMWVAQHCRFNHPRNHLTSGALGTMGFGLPAAMGAQFACPDRTVVLVSGDGSFMMNVQELATIARCRLPVKIVLLDNSSLGMVRQWQELFFAERYSEIDLSDNPDFVALAQVFGIAATRIDARDDVEGGLAALLAEPGPALLHVAIDARANVWPLVPPNTANSTMLESNPAHARALLRVIGMAERRGFAPRAISGAPVAADDGRWHLQLVVDGQRPAETLCRQIEKIYDCVSVQVTAVEGASV